MDGIQWTGDEAWSFKFATNELHIFAGGMLRSEDLVAKVYHKAYTQFKVAPGSSPLVNIALFNPDSKGNPGRVTVYSFNPVTHTVSEALGTRTIFGANEATLLWNSLSSTLLIFSQSAVDSSNASYYGAAALYLMSSNGELSIKVEQTKEGSVHDVQWSPDGEKFVLAAGNMPCQVTLYNLKAEPIYQFGAAHRNTIKWSPHGRFLCIAGFGNLAGEMDFYDMLRLKKIGMM